MPVFALTSEHVFPSPELARRDGLLAVGGDLSESRLLLAYRMGIFPWYSPGQPILWWSPNPRLVLFPKEFHVSKSLARLLRRGVYHVTMDTAFDQVIASCARIHIDKDAGTWIVPEMELAYCRLHEEGFAHSVETWQDGKLVGGLYGVSLGRTFFGESMFFEAPNASKIALAALFAQILEWEFDLVDCQIRTGHLMRLGAREIHRRDFLSLLEHSTTHPTRQGKWELQVSSADFVGGRGGAGGRPLPAGGMGR